MMLRPTVLNAFTTLAPAAHLATTSPADVVVPAARPVRPGSRGLVASIRTLPVRSSALASAFCAAPPRSRQKEYFALACSLCHRGAFRGRARLRQQLSHRCRRRRKDRGMAILRPTLPKRSTNIAPMIPIFTMSPAFQEDHRTVRKLFYLVVRDSPTGNRPGCRAASALACAPPSRGAKAQTTSNRALASSRS